MERFPAGSIFIVPDGNGGEDELVVPGECFAYTGDRSADVDDAGLTGLLQQVLSCKTIDDVDALVTAFGPPGELGRPDSPLAGDFRLLHMYDGGRVVGKRDDGIMGPLSFLRFESIQFLLVEFHGRSVWLDNAADRWVASQIIPATLMLWQVRYLQAHLLAALHLLDPRPDLAGRLRTTVEHLRIPSPGLPPWAEAALDKDPVAVFEEDAATWIAGHLTLFTPKMFSTSRPSLGGSWAMDDWLRVELYNDAVQNYPVKMCANPDCNVPFTRQAGQSLHRQSRRDAVACSKSCSDRISYLRRRSK